MSFSECQPLMESTTRLFILIPPPSQLCNTFNGPLGVLMQTAGNMTVLDDDRAKACLGVSHIHVHAWLSSLDCEMGIGYGQCGPHAA